MILLIDNFDSFVANIARYFRRLQLETLVVRNHEIDLRRVEQLNPRAIVVSPGPCRPEQAGNSPSIVGHFSGSIPILGICLGHQAIAMDQGAEIVRAPEPVHGRQSTLTHNGHFLFSGVPEKFDACRYHSLIVRESTLPSNLQVTSRTADGIIMSIADDQQQLYGLQFHPESILTPFGFRILENFVRRIGYDPQPIESALYESETNIGVEPDTRFPPSHDIFRHPEQVMDWKGTAS